jgi:GT2 family glycosyltransferase
MKITASVSTRNRYFTTLPLCLTAIANQTKVPEELIIFDDGEHRDIRNEPVYQNIFSHLTKRGIFWHVEFGSGEGQVKNHQRTLETAKHELIWRLDDDNVPEANVLETLFGELGKQTGAIGGLVLDPKGNLHPNKLASSKIEDIFLGQNEQWFPHEKPSIKQVAHLYSTFLFRKEAAAHGYETSLSRVGHREETIFTYEMKRKGWNLQVTPHAVTWHYHNPVGGIRDNTNKEMWDHDEAIFSEKMKQWGVVTNQYFPIVMNNGLGDHLAFKTLMPEILNKYGNQKILLAVCYPDLYREYAMTNQNVRILSIADAQMSYGEGINQFDIYKWMVEHHWAGHMLGAFRALYNLETKTV